MCACDMRNDDEGDMNTIIDIIICDRSRHDTTRRLYRTKIPRRVYVHILRMPISGGNGVEFRTNRGFCGRIL